jgi:hypothetical protein
MGEDQEIRSFDTELHRQVAERLAVEPGHMARDAFVRLVAEYLVDDGSLEDLQVCYLRTARGNSHMEVAGYEISDDGTVLDLVTAQYPEYGAVVPRSQVRRLLRRAETFAEACHQGGHRDLEESSPAFDMTQRIHTSWDGLRELRIFLLTDGRVTVDRLGDMEVAGLRTTYHIWDITRLYRLVTSGRRQEEIVIDLVALGDPIPCLEAPKQADGYRSLLAVFPGQLLADLYDQHHGRLLQRNVRAYLQTRGKVNREINRTIQERPERFLAYNNGISATAADVVMQRSGDGTTAITHITDLQIVNGGQTTASLHHAWKRDGADLSEVHVPAKITVVPGEVLDELVPWISRYANSQNAIRPADFEANSPFHVGLERLSRTVWAPATDGSTRQTRWYYERVRGQYQVDRSRRATPARRRAFEQEFPPSQRFGKTDAAKYEVTHLCLPHVVCLGAEKCFQAWTMRMELAERSAPDIPFFQELVAKAILFEHSRKLIHRMRLGGYLAQSTAYTLALLVERMGETLDLDRIWRLQALPGPVAQTIPELVSTVREVIVDPPGSGNVTEWCKKEACWDAVRRIPWEPPVCP